MKIFEIRCPGCAAVYRVAESSSEQGLAERLDCARCGSLVADWREPKMRVYRLIVPAEKAYLQVPAPPPL